MKRTAFISFLYACVAWLLGTTNVYGQLDVQQLTEQQGLGNNTINEIHQDKKGFLWIGTDIGLTRYDGNFFHTYNLSQTGKGEPISVSKIQEVDDRLLWIHCEEGDIVCFDKKREKTIPIQWGNGIEQENIYQFSSTGKRLYAIMTDGLHIVDVKSDGTMIIPEHKLLLPNKKLNKVISTLFVNSAFFMKKVSGAIRTRSKLLNFTAKPGRWATLLRGTGWAVAAKKASVQKRIRLWQ